MKFFLKHIICAYIIFNDASLLYFNKLRMLIKKN